MRVNSEGTGGVFVARDPAGTFIELLVEEAAPDDAQVVRLSSDEARRLAGLLLFQAARLDPHRVSRGSREETREEPLT